MNQRQYRLPPLYGCDKSAGDKTRCDLIIRIDEYNVVARGGIKDVVSGNAHLMISGSDYPYSGRSPAVEFANPQGIVQLAVIG